MRRKLDYISVKMLILQQHKYSVFIYCWTEIGYPCRHKWMEWIKICCRPSQSKWKSNNHWNIFVKISNLISLLRYKDTYPHLNCVPACVRMFVGACCLLVRHVKDSRRSAEIQWWACFITSHIETNLWPFSWRTASYSLTKLASCCGVKRPPQARSTTV